MAQLTAPFLCLLIATTSGVTGDKSPASTPVDTVYDQQTSGTGGYKSSVFFGNAEVKNTVPNAFYGAPNVHGSSLNFDHPPFNSIGHGKDFHHNNVHLPTFQTSSSGGYGGALNTSPPHQHNSVGSPYDHGNSIYPYNHHNIQKPYGEDLPFLEDFGGLGGGLLGGLGGAGGLLAVAKGLLALKPLLLMGLLLFFAFPIFLSFLPIPIITFSGLPSIVQPAESSPSRGLGSGLFESAMLTARACQHLNCTSWDFDRLREFDTVVNTEECLERIVCKINEYPKKYKDIIRDLWEEYGRKYFTSETIQRAMKAHLEHLEEKSGPTHFSKCNKKFKCSNKDL